MKNQDLLSIIIIVAALLIVGLMLLIRHLRSRPAIDLSGMTQLQRITFGLVKGGQALFILGFLLTVLGGLFEWLPLSILGAGVLAPGLTSWVIGSQIK